MKRTWFLVVIAVVLATPIAKAQLGAGSGTTTITVTVGAEAALTVSSSTILTTVGTNFGNYTSGTPTTVTYFVRTTQSTGSGTITLKVTSDFSPVNGPSVGTPPTAGDALKYTCGGSAPATPCSGSQTASTGASTPVATFGADAHTTTAGSTASTTWTLTNDPVYKTGTYNATVTYTISAS